MSIFASQTSQTVLMPFDPPHTITIRKLTGREVEKAQEADAINLAKGSARTWAARLKRMAATGDPKAMDALHDPLIGYDRFAIIRFGLMAWTYEQKPADTIDDLDDEAATFIALAILKLTKPGLFLTGEAVEDAQKELSVAASLA